MRKNDSSKTVKTRATPGGSAKKAAPVKRALTSRTQKRKLVHDARLVVASITDHRKDVRPEAACLYHAVALQCLAMKRHGARLILQAGSAHWVRGTDPGHPDHLWGYAWEPGEVVVSETLRAFGGHVWLAHTDPDTIVDSTTGIWPADAKAHGHGWPAKRPPDFLWEPCDSLRVSFGDVAFFVAEPAAIEAANASALADVYPLVMPAIGIPWEAPA